MQDKTLDNARFNTRYKHQSHAYGSTTMTNIKIHISSEGTEILTYFTELEPSAIARLVDDMASSVKSSMSDRHRIWELEAEVKSLKGEEET